MATVGEQLKRIRNNRSLTVEEIAKRSGVSEQDLVEIESDALDVPISKLLKISKALNVTFYIGVTEI